MDGENVAAGRVESAMSQVDRTRFLPADQRRYADQDRALRIGHGSTCSQPTTVRTMLVLLGPRPGERVLDVGAGSGWTCALLAVLTAPGGTVVGTELTPEVADFGRANLGAAEVTDVVLHDADPQTLGWPGGAPYDRILVSADAAELPAQLVAQLADPGRMVLPVRGEMTVVDLEGGRQRVRTAGAYRFVPLRTDGD